MGVRPYLRKAILAGVLENVNFDQFSIETVVDRVAAYRGRPIRLEPRPAWMFRRDGFGCWLASDCCDYIFYDEETVSVHRNHIILHELSHMLLGHQTYRVQPGSRAAEAVLMRSLARVVREEREAEVMATEIQRTIIERLGIQALSQERGTMQVWSEQVTNNLI